MKGGKTPLGYTIVEVMIVLAASGVMFVIAAGFINGKQAKTSFTSGVNELASRVQGTIEQVTDGQYSDILITCQSSGTGVTITSGGSEQGSNSECLFLGKVMHFSLDNKPDRYEVFSLAGGRLTNSAPPTPITTLDEAYPQAIHDLTTTQSVPQSLEVTSVKFNDEAITSYGLGFIQNILPGGDAAKGAQPPPSLYYVDTMSADKNNTDAESAINRDNLKPAKNATICVTDGSRYAKIRIGLNTSQQTVKVEMLGSTAC